MQTCKGQEELLKESVEVIKKSVALNTSFPSLLPKTPAPSTPAKKETSAFITPVKPKENAFLQAISSISKSKPEEIIPVPIVEPPKEVKKAPSFQMPAPKIKEQKPVEAPIAPVFGFDMKQQVKQQVPVLQTIPTPVKPSSPPLTEKTKTAKDVLDQVAKFPDFQLPKVTFKSPPPSQLSSHTSLQSVKSLKEFDLPIFNFGSASYSQNGDAEKLPNGHSLLTRLGPASTPPSIEVPKTSLSSKPALAGWTCNICLVNNSDDAVKCVACESDKPEAKKVQNTAKPVFEMPKSTTTSSQSFNWPSSGSNFKPITNSGWSCPVCMISNKMDAMKCAACEAGKPGSSSVNTIKPVTTTSKNGFSFAAPTGWSCSVCLVNNKSDANKCIACETDKPGHKSSSDTVKEAPKMPVPPSLTSGGFSFGAFAAPAGWSCSVCLVNNKSDANKCIACETDKPGTKSSSASGSQPQFSMPAPPAAATSFSFGSSISNFGTPSGTTSEGKKDEDSNSGFSFGFGSQSSSLPSTGFSFGGQ